LQAPTEPEASKLSGVFASIVAMSADAIICIDAMQRIVEFNRGAERMFLRSREDAIGQPIEILIPESFRAAHAKHVERYSMSGEPRRMARERPAVRGLRSNGEEFIVEATIARHEVGGQLWLSVIVRDLTEQARIDTEIERRWRALFEAASEGIFISDSNGRYIDANRAASDLLGYRHDELIDMTIADVIPPDQVERLAEAKRQIEAGGTRIAEWSLRHKDGSYVPVEVSSKLLPDGRWVAFVRDIRNRKSIETALYIDQQRLRVALTGSPVSAFNQDLELRYTWSFNLPALMSTSGIVGKTQEEAATPSLAKHLVEVKRGVIATGIPARELLTSVIGGREHYFDTRIEPLRDPSGRIIGITGAGWDVTERKRAEDEQRLFARVSAALNATALDWTQMLTSIAPLALGMLADFCIAEIIDEAGLVQRCDVVHVDPRKAPVCDALRLIVLDRERPHLTYEVIRTGRPVLVGQVSPSYLESVAQSDHYLEVLRDLELRSLIVVPLQSRERLLGAYVLGSSTREYGPDDLRSATELAERVAVAVDNARLHRAIESALQARAAVLEIVAHDLRTPLHSILLELDFLSRSLKDHQRSAQSIERIRRSARRMSRLTQDLLDVVRLEAGEPLAIELADVAPRHVAEAALETLQPQAAASSLALVLECDSDLTDIRADHGRLVQVLDNLIGNAIKFSPRGARIVVGIRQRSGEVEFAVADTGPGLAPDQVEHLFDRFWQADRNDRRGSGLGLSVVKGILDAHRGKIWVEARVGQGSTFYFTIPSCSTPRPG
jgi:PAS domain S-box-containing protein